MTDNQGHRRQLLAPGTKEARLDLAVLVDLARKPAPYAPGEPLFWDDPHISAQMLRAHLNPHTDAASRRPATIEATVAWLRERLDLLPGRRLLDLGCGPGLYAERLARGGIAVTGVDYSRSSIAHARGSAQAAGLAVQYHHQDYLTLDYQAAFDVAIMVYYDFGVLPPAERGRLLDRVHASLVPGGRFVFDVLTREGREAGRAEPGWEASTGGFWRPGEHLVLTRVHSYPEQAVELDEYLVIDPDGTVTPYRVWQSYHTEETITRILAERSFVVEDVYGDLTGQPLRAGSEGLGVVARRLP